ncbi:uncharacterized protein CTHT_0065630 [Thermochaetoides thermophila DSM 1495]|uniref:Spindle pole body component n=1 Tax=Chaetomium thermophilum (strain DSM 1495 / CBS 144.50 / IMI 039719) TaxID=759272 RepID=G0SGA5_CHATD|nr:hypothetical protein CTHT_0065630 [Thermochaetoides thermophila DSM 1495]EGS17244.1 hypothetical protein CTHT_0065630 [Thermochaetoides thermophila DSM 1495]
MAFLAQLGALADDLVSAIVGIPEDQTTQRDACRDFVLRSLRHHNFGRTNQFEVQDRLNGLEERFSIVGRDALADALRTRLDALEPHQNQFTPELLHLLLELADQPAQKARLSDLGGLDKPKKEEAPPLTWRQIAKEDNWKDDPEIWRFISYREDSSDDDRSRADQPADSQSVISLESLTTATTEDESCRLTPEDLVVEPDGADLLRQIQKAQSWRNMPALDAEGPPKKTPISTIHLLREALFMLSGLETTLFDQDCAPALDYQLHGVAWTTYKALATSFSECGRKLIPLRSFIKTKEQSPLLQVFQDSAQKALASFDRTLSSIQERFVSIQADTIVSAMSVLEEVSKAVVPLHALSGIVRQLGEERNPHAFRYLELLYDSVELAQLQGQMDTYKLLGRAFFDCFQVYLRPIRLWMEEGRVLPGDRTFFVSESPTKLPLSQVWKGQFNLRQTPDGALHAPRFLKFALHRIFTAGKSIVVLKHMKRHEPVTKYGVSAAEPKMDFETVCPPELEFAPFSELFNTAFQNWIESKHHTAAVTLRELLFTSYGLSEELRALQHVYFMSNYSVVNDFTSSIFRHIDTVNDSWQDRFALTELAQDALSSCIIRERLSAEIDLRILADHVSAPRNSVRFFLPAIRLRYRLPWPVQIVVPEDSIRAYQTVFTYQLQLHRALSALHQPIFTFRKPSPAKEQRLYYRLHTHLLWFTNTLLTYLTTFVLAPNTAQLTTALDAAEDIDEMVAAHGAFVSRILAESGLTPAMAPIREAILDVLDLAIRVEGVHHKEAERWEREKSERERLEVMASPYTSPEKKRRLLALPPRRARRSRGISVSEEDWDDQTDEVGRAEEGKSYGAMLRDSQKEFERLLRFVAAALRGTARASKDEAASKWDMLAEMLEAGIKESMHG